MAEGAKIGDALKEQINALGFSPAQFGADLEGFAKFTVCRPNVLGICAPINTHVEFLAACEWQEGSLLLVREDSPRFVLWEQFFCLETLEFPKDLISLRDYFDYGLETKIRELRPDVHPQFGPGWRYLFPCADFLKNLKSSTLNLSAPMMGNALNIRSDSLNDLMSAQTEIKSHMASKLPIPLVWAYPSGLPVSAKDNFCDLDTRGWYFATLEGDFEGAVSLVDLRPDERGLCNVKQHDFKGHIDAVEMKINDMTVKFSSAADDFKSRRKLSRLKVSYLW